MFLAALITRRGGGVVVVGSMPVGAVTALSSWKVSIQTFSPSVPC